MASPQPGGLTRADEAALHADRREQLHEASREGESIAEELRCGGGYVLYRAGTGRCAHAGRTTMRRFGSSPSDSVATPSTSDTASWTTLRSKGVIGSILTA